MKKIAVVGSGTMGNGIAHVFAQYGFFVNLIDLSEDALKRAMITIDRNLGRQVDKGLITSEQKAKAITNITTVTSVKEGVKMADLVVEAVSENADLKLKLFKELDECTAPATILATNTSSISITRIASATKHPERVIGMHFMNPVPVMKLVEVIQGYDTARNVTDAVVSLSKKIEKVPVEVKDYPGFVSNRVLMPMINEAIETLHEGVAGVEEIDSVMKLGMAHPMGPLLLADLIGLDVCLSIMRVLHDGFGNPKYAPCPLLVNMVQAGHTGMKSGAGFYVHKAGTKEIEVAPQFKGGR